MAGINALGNQFKQISQLSQLNYIRSLFSGGGLQTQGTSMFQADTGLYGVNRASSSALAKLQISAIKQGGIDLSGAVANLNKPSNFNSLTAVKPGDTASTGKKTQSVSIETAQLASAQINKSTGAQAFERLNMSGQQSFALEQNGKQTMFSVNITTADTNRSAQQKIADVINKNKDLGITAKVEYNEDSGNSSLVLAGRETGEKNGFSVRDINGSLVTALGLNNVATAAQNAQFSVDGVSQTSASNNVYVGGGAAVELTEIGEQTYDLYNNASEAKDALNDFIQQFNELSDTAGVYGSQKLTDRLNAIYRQSATELAKVGVYGGVDGKLRMNEQLIERSINNGSLEKTLGVGKKGGFLDLVNKAAEEAEDNPAKFSDQVNSNAFNYSSLYDASYGTDYRLYAAEMNASNMGMLFDYLM